jgi:RNA polymerase sigma-70 factor (ECF subfamily)
MNEQQRDNLFSDLITRHQNQLYGYIFAVVRNWEDADDLFQSVCLALWANFESFQIGTNFLAWARLVARNKITDFLRRKRSARHASEELLVDLADAKAAEGRQERDGETYLAALEHCREKLNNADEELLELHYAEELGSRQIAERLQRSQPSVCNSLNRIRCWLLECIRMEMARQEHS